MTGRIAFDVPESIYHSGPELSSTGARKILDSPARYRFSQDHPQEHKDAFDLGTAVHTKVLGTGSDVVLVDFDSWRSKAAQEVREVARSNDQAAMLRKDYQPVLDMAEAVLAHPTARALFEQDGRAEASVYATDPDTGVQMRARFDWLPNLDGAKPIAVDLKTTGKSASTTGFERSIVDYGYDIQQEWYLKTLGIDIPFVFVVVETSAPHLVGVHQIDTIWRGMGRTATRRAIDIYAECSATDTWPGYPNEVQLVSPPIWAVRQHEEKYS